MVSSTVLLDLVKDLDNASNEIPLVSGITKATKSNCKNIIKAKKANTVPAPIEVNRTGINEGITAAKIQCTELPKDCPEPLKWLGKISEINTQITVPWPMACAAMNKNRKIATDIPSQSKKKAQETKVRDIIYPIDPRYINCFLPNLSIRKIPKSVNSKLVTPIPILLNKAVLSPSPASSKILGA